MIAIRFCPNCNQISAENRQKLKNIFVKKIYYFSFIFGFYLLPDKGESCDYTNIFHLKVSSRKYFQTTQHICTRITFHCCWERGKLWICRNDLKIKSFKCEMVCVPFISPPYLIPISLTHNCSVCCWLMSGLNPHLLWAFAEQPIYLVLSLAQN